ncbi:MAG: LPS-assembly protein LptD [Bacteroidetes bacterium]|nr:LPS-assembly protein LptD [Bacteroidota bacterium]
MTRLIIILILPFTLVFPFCEYCSGNAIDTIPPPDTISAADTLNSKSSGAGSLAVPRSANAVDSKVIYNSRDSMRFDVGRQKVFLYGDASVTYKDIKLQAGYIEFDLQKNLIYASGYPDTSGTEKEKPVFSDGNQEFNAKNMTYNFKTKKGRVKDVITKEGEGFIHGDSIFKDPEDVLYIKSGRYTTCSDEHPHFAINSGRLKIIPDDKLVTGPAYLEVADVPTPLALPFGIFPLKKGRSSGVLIPAPGESPGKGFFLKEGGYYFGISDYLDLTLLGDIYSNGSWALKSAIPYMVKYRYSGNLGINYAYLKNGDKDFPGYSLNKDFQIVWRHNKDNKARPSTVFRSDINFVSGNYLQYNSYDPEEHLSNTISSTVTFGKTIGKHSLSVVTGFTQYSDRQSVTVRLPDLSWSISSFNPFKSKKRIGTPSWYENIRTGYSMNMRNEISIPDTVIFKKLMEEGIITNTMNDTFLDKNPGYYDEPIPWNKYLTNGIKHNVPVSTSLRVLKYLTFNPSFNYTERWYAQTSVKRWNESSGSIITDTVKGFKSARDFNFSAPLSTQVYGMYNFGDGPVNAIRHILTPSFGFSWRPDFSDPFWGYYRTVQKDTDGNTLKYSVFEKGIFGSPESGKYGALFFSVNNNLEMKVRTRRDTINPVKKIKLIEGLSVSSSYNLVADSMNLSPFSVAGRTNLSNLVNLSFSGQIDPYTLDSDSVRINKLQWETKKNIGRMTNGTISVNFTLRGKPQNTSGQTGGSGTGKTDFGSGGYLPFNIPWSLNINYIFMYSRPYFHETFDQTLKFDGTLNLTNKWRITFSSGLDFKTMKLNYTSVDIIRDLHCWEMKFHWVPFGTMKSYLLDIHVKAAVLQELKIERKKDWYDYQ